MIAFAEQIKLTALELGYEHCGILPLKAYEGFEEKLEERMVKAPGSHYFYEGQKRLIDPRTTFPWAKSVIVLAKSYSKYRVPKALENKIAKYYLFDVRKAPLTLESEQRQVFRTFLEACGLKVNINEGFGDVAMRWAAMMTGLGIVRKNNFFYTASGSWVHLESWLIDAELTHIENNAPLPACPPQCTKCIDACPSKALSEPFTMNPLKCISFLTTFGGKALEREPLAATFGDCIYGCDLCQDACPMNRGKWQGTEDFPGLDALVPHLSPKAILAMDETFYQQSIYPKFFYVGKDELWKWQINALNYLDLHEDEADDAVFSEACHSAYENVRTMATHICNRRNIPV